MLNSVLMLLARDRYVSDGCEEAMAQGLAESYARRWGYCYPNAQAWPPRAPNGLPDTPGVPGLIWKGPRYVNAEYSPG
jgi:hypothetical protein